MVNNPVYWCDPSGADSSPNRWLQDFRGDWHHVLGHNFVTLWDASSSSSSEQTFADFIGSSYDNEQDYADLSYGADWGDGTVRIVLPEIVVGNLTGSELANAIREHVYQNSPHYNYLRASNFVSTASIFNNYFGSGATVIEIVPGSVPFWYHK